MKTLKETGELKAISLLTQSLRQRSDVVEGPGDDCAVVRVGPQCVRDLLLKSDPVISGVHFDSSARPAQIGHKALGRVLSDIASMGGEPRWALFNIVAPPDTGIKTIEQIYKGARALAARHNVSIVGGDLSSGRTIEIHAFAVGVLPRGKSVLRSGARPGDSIFVTGALGGSIRGKHLDFEPRVKEGLFIRNWATSMIDISDGLASDLGHIAERSRISAIIESAAVPVAPAARRLKDSRTPLEHALYDGEDFELLFTVPAEREKAFRNAWPRKFRLPCTRIGKIVAGRNVISLLLPDGTTVTVKEKGYEHFRK